MAVTRSEVGGYKKVDKELWPLLLFFYKPHLKAYLTVC